MTTYKCQFAGSIAGLVIFFSLSFNSSLFSQSVLTLNGGIGYTNVDLNSWSGKDELSDWGQTMSEFYAQLYFSKLGNFNVGLEGGYQYFFWYEFIYNDGYYKTHYVYDINCWRIAAIARANLKNQFLTEFGLGYYFFDGYSDFGFLGSLGYEIKITKKAFIPVKFRTSVILDADANLTVFGISAGLVYKFK